MPTDPDPATIAIIDDDPTQRLLLSAILSRAGHSTSTHGDARSLHAADLRGIGVVCLDLGLGSDSGLDLLAHLHLRDPELPIVVITADSEIESAVTAMRAGAYDYLVKLVDPTRLCTVVSRALERRMLAARVRQLTDRLAHRNTSMLIGDSAPMQTLRRQIARVAGSPVTVCIRGETGTGKELVARAIHEASSRQAAPFVPVNCASIPVSLQESELFGHERGAFTGATSVYRGRFEQADRGTLFLDELGEMSAAAQGSMLRALQDRTVRRLGSTQDLHIDVRILSATHRDLEDEVRAGRFREDLYYRLVIYPITVPPLRERVDDIPQLVGAFMSRIAGETGLATHRVSPDVLEALMRHDWPGNVRELQNVVHRAMLSSEGDELGLADLPNDLRALKPITVAVARAPRPAPEENLSMAEVETTAIMRALNTTHGNVSSAARLLKIGRATLYRRISELKLDVASLRVVQF
ncbi:MAG: sigma-54 dependent transcriptional regulator [Proteobacteria bacterium]|nr:sigma-54 dependent transcriptional regulator [Pseudomonadota bacterium]